MNKRLRTFSVALISLHTSSTFLRRVRSLRMKVVSASDWMALSSEMIRSAASWLLCMPRGQKL